MKFEDLPNPIQEYVSALYHAEFNARLDKLLYGNKNEENKMRDWQRSFPKIGEIVSEELSKIEKKPIVEKEGFEPTKA